MGRGGEWGGGHTLVPFHNSNRQGIHAKRADGCESSHSCCALALHALTVPTMPALSHLFDHRIHVWPGRVLSHLLRARAAAHCSSSACSSLTGPAACGCRQPPAQSNLRAVCACAGMPWPGRPPSGIAHPGIPWPGRPPPGLRRAPFHGTAPTCTAEARPPSSLLRMACVGEEAISSRSSLAAAALIALLATASGICSGRGADASTR